MFNNIRLSAAVIMLAVVGSPMMAFAGSVGTFVGGTNAATDISAFITSSSYVPATAITDGSFDASGLTTAGTYTIDIDILPGAASATGSISISGLINSTVTPETLTSTDLLNFDISDVASSHVRALFGNGPGSTIFSDVFYGSGIADTSSTTSSVPLPAAVWAGAGMLAILGIGRRLRHVYG